MKQQKKHKPAAPPIKPKFVYTSTCCGSTATKPPCVWADEDKNAKPPKFSQSTLGTWRCSNCGQKTKVTRSKAV